MSTQQTLVQRYLQDFRSYLGQLGEQDRSELCLEIESHIHEALSAGHPLADVLERLGPAKRLAKAYTAELFLDAPAGQGPSLRQLTKAAGILAGTSLSSLILVPPLFVVGVGFLASGILAVVLALISFFVPSLVTVTDNIISKPAASALAVVLGVVIALVGWGALALLRRYLAFLTRTYRRTFAA